MWRLEKIQRLFEHHPTAKVYAVGGFVRDGLMKGPHAIKDIDIEIHGVEPIQVLDMLTWKFKNVSEVGKSFGVFKIRDDNGTEYDISLPRKDSKTSSGHTGFDVSINPFMGIREALRRRDFTINAMAYHTDGEALTLHDPFGGHADLQDKILRVVDPETFVEDPLRVLRGVQFASRFGLTIEPETFELMRRLVCQ